jgi:Spy/CpxP family protein refolding chaperone
MPDQQGVNMNFNKAYVAALAMTGCALALSVYARRQHNQRVKARELRHALEVWENEGGIVPPSSAQTAQVR